MKTNLKEIGLAWLLRWGGALLARAGHSSLAAQLFRAAENLVPSDLPSYEYANSLWRDGQFDAAKLTLIKILSRIPDHAEAHNLLGVLYFEEDKMELAAQHFERAIDKNPNYAAPRNNLGNIHRAKQELDKAVGCYRAALECDVRYVEALTNLGAVLDLQGDDVAAEDYCRKAIELAPGFAGAQCNLGNVLLSLGRGGEAVAAYREALRLQPDLPEAQVNLALILEDSTYLIGTIDYYERQLQRQPNNHQPHVRIAQALQALKRWEDARQRLNRALELKPEAPDALYVLAVNYTHVGDVPACIDCLRRLLSSGPNASAQALIAFDSLYLEDCAGEQLLAEFRDWAELYLVRPPSKLPPRSTADRERRLRIGYVSRDFARHSVAYFLEPILKHHDRERFEVFCYSTLIRGDHFTERFRALADTWRDISTLPEKSVVKLVGDDEIDILVDLSGHTVGNRLGVFACKPAPVQVTYLGHPATTGLEAIDYRLGDAVADPLDRSAGHFVERLWHLPGCFLTYQPNTDVAMVSEPPSLIKQYVTFGSFNNPAKINDHVIAVWAQILSAIPSSRLLLKSYAFASSRGRDRLTEGFSRHGIASERLDLVDWRDDVHNHLELYGDVDIALDTFPYNGTTTTCEALWMGVPVVCLNGQRHSARVGASLLTVLGLRQLLASDSAEFVRIAVEMAGDPKALRELRAGMRDRMLNSPLLDHAGFTKGLEQAYREMWRVYCDRRVAGEVGSGADGEAPVVDTAISLTLAGIATVRVPDSLNVMTRYVVEEQGDWFEDEIRFIRKLLLPNQRVIDVGANYGVYTLSMAAAVGVAGKVYSFEPAPSTIRWLRESVESNGFRQVQILEAAVSDISGRGHFEVAANAELSRLLAADESNAEDIGVDLMTLDGCREELRWGRIDFIKIDAEGQEPNVVRGGRRLLDHDSPLVMAEYKHGNQLNHGVTEEFAKSGFEAYRLVPGLMLLMPLEDIGDVDPYLLNLFFCREDTAQALSARGLLVPPDGLLKLAVGDRTRPECEWRGYLARFPYARAWTSHAHEQPPQDRSFADGLAISLNSYARAQQEDLPPAERLAALKEALAAAANPIHGLAGILTLARIRADLGFRNEARDLFIKILADLQRGDATPDDGPFLAPSRKFERVDCTGQLTDWLIAAVAEWLATNSGFSSFFVADEALRYLQVVRRAGYGEGDVQRRIDLILRLRRSNAGRRKSNS